MASDHEYFVMDRLIDAYKQCGFKVEFLGWDRRSKQSATTFYRGVRCRYAMRGWGYANWGLLLALPLWCLRLFAKLLVDDSKVIHAVDFDCALPAALAGLFRKKNIIYDIQDNFEARRSFSKLGKAILCWVNLWVVRRCSEIIVTDKNRIIGGLENFRGKLTVVANCPPDLSTGNQLAPKRGELVVAAFGVNLTSMRGIGLLINASARVPGVKVMTAGRLVEPWLEAKLRAASQVEYLGWLAQDEILRRTCDADVVFAFYDPSIEINRRASSAKWYDAMMAGRPVVSNREIMNAPWIEEEGFGFICDYSEESLATLLTWLRDHPDALRDKGNRARQLFEARFNRHAMNIKICRTARRACGLTPPHVRETIQA
jgi:glycosyltransferase involved in cell wall biosynthesis